MSPSLALKAIYTTCQKLNLVPKGLLAFKPKCMIMTGPADRLSWFSTSELVFGCWPIEHMTYRKVSSSRPVYLYSILELFGQSSQYISIEFPLHTPSENLKTCY